MSEKLGRYTLERKIAAGGMAEIYLARQDGSNNTCVIKRMLPELMVDPQFMRMFLDEAKLVAQLHHPQIATIYDFGHEHGVLFLAMEHVEGGNLRSIVKDNAKKGTWMQPHHAAAIVAQAARALDYAHQAVTIDKKPMNLIHRDVSPQNILLGKDGMVKLIDFGVARSETATQRTAAGMIKGKFAYMSPEQIRGQQLDGRSDLFGLGLVLYELLANMRAVPGVSDAEMAQNALAMRIAPIQTVRPDIPVPLLKSLEKVLQRDKNLRHGRGNDLAVELETFVRAVAPRFHPSELGMLFGLPHPQQILSPAQPKMALATPLAQQPASLMQATVELPPGVIQGEIRRRAITVDGPTIPPGAGMVATTMPGQLPGIPTEELGNAEPTDRVMLAKTEIRPPSSRSAPQPVIGTVKVQTGSLRADDGRPPTAPAPAMITPMAGPAPQPEQTLTPSLQRAVRSSRGPWIAIGLVFAIGVGLIGWTLLHDQPQAPKPVNAPPVVKPPEPQPPPQQAAPPTPAPAPTPAHEEPPPPPAPLPQDPAHGVHGPPPVQHHAAPPSGGPPPTHPAEPAEGPPPEKKSEGPPPSRPTQ
ncbi:MAG: serine/threonine-protein kinase [Myxococcaceae bacterium]